MKTFFNIRYEFDREAVHTAIEEQVRERRPDYICVADGVILNNANRRREYLDVVNGGMFSICDSSFVPLYIKWIYGKRYPQYCGSDIFLDIVKQRRYRMIFLGTSASILLSLKENLIQYNPDIRNMLFIELPFRKAEDFDYERIAEVVKQDEADIIWVALGAPKQEYFMHYLKPHLDSGVMIAVGAVFKFFSNKGANRAPEWMVRHHLEFVHRIFEEPKKQLKRCSKISLALPKILYDEWRRKRDAQ